MLFKYLIYIVYFLLTFRIMTQETNAFTIIGQDFFHFHMKMIELCILEHVFINPRGFKFSDIILL